MTVQFEASTTPVAKHLKILLWGASGTRKTETPLRYFPACAVIDTEGGTDLCRAMPEIPPFVALKTADIYEAIEAIELVVAGKVQMPDGSPVQTIVIDSMSVLWHVRQEAGLLQAEGRARRRAKGHDLNPDAVDMSFNDWGKAKRPIRQLMNRLNSIPFHVAITARQKDLYLKRPGAQSDSDLVKAGETFDAEKNLDYEVDAAFHLTKSASGWQAKVTKVRGRLGKAFPVGKEFTAWPTQELLAQASVTGPESQAPDQDRAATAQVVREGGRTMAGLIEYATSLGLSREALRAALAEHGYTAYKPEHHDAMLEIVRVAGNGKSPAPER